MMLIYPLSVENGGNRGPLRAVLRGRLLEQNVPKADLCAIKALQLSPDGQLAIAEDNGGNVRAIATDTGTAS